MSKATKAVTGETTLSFVNLNAPKAAQEGAKPKYSASVIIPKSDKDTLDRIIGDIQKLRDGTVTYDDVIIATLLNMDNYKEALDAFLEREATEELICEIGINRKSRKYDKPYFRIYKQLREIVFDDKNNIEKIFRNEVCYGFKDH